MISGLRTRSLPPVDPDARFELLGIRDGNEDSPILKVANDLIVRLAPKGQALQSVAWVGEEFCPDLDQPALLRRGWRLGLREELRGKLSVDEWRPLLASSVVFNIRMRRRRRLFDLVLLFPFLSVLGLSVGIIWLGLFPLLPPYGWRGSSNPAGQLFLLLFFGVLFFFARITRPYRRRLRLRADEVVSSELGMGGDLLRVLEKIDSFIIYSGPNRLRSATIKERIENLSRVQA